METKSRPFEDSELSINMTGQSTWGRLRVIDVKSTLVSLFEVLSNNEVPKVRFDSRVSLIQDPSQS